MCHASGWPAGGQPGRQAEPEGAQLVAALEEALLGAGIRGSLREQARALERGAPLGGVPPHHRRLPSDPNAPDFAVAAAGALSPQEGVARGGVLTVAPAASSAASASFSSSRARSSSMALLKPTREEEDAAGPRAREGGVRVGRRWSADAGPGQPLLPVHPRGAQARSPPRALAAVDGDGSGSAASDGDGASGAVDYETDDEWDGASGDSPGPFMADYPGSGEAGGEPVADGQLWGVSQEGLPEDALHGDAEGGPEAMYESYEPAQGIPHEHHPPSPERRRPLRQRKGWRAAAPSEGEEEEEKEEEEEDERHPAAAWMRVQDGRAGSGGVAGDAEATAAALFGVSRSSAASPEAQPALTLTPSPGASSPLFGSFDQLLAAQGDQQEGPPAPGSPPTPPPPAPRERGGASPARSSERAWPQPPPVAVPSAVENRIQWERTVSSLDSLLPGAARAAVDGEDGGDSVYRGSAKGGDPFREACARASAKVHEAVAVARHHFSLRGMLSAPDAAPLRVALKEARDFAEALAALQPAARRLLVADFTSGIADASAAAVTGMNDLSRHLQAQLVACCEASADAALPRACMDVSGVVAGGKPLGEALHALMRWGRHVAEFADPSDLQTAEAVSADFTALFLRLALLWGALVSAAHAARRTVDDWRWAHALEELGKDQLLFVRSLSLQGFAQGALAGADFAALKDTVDATVLIVKALDQELSAPHELPGVAAAGAPGGPPGAQSAPGPAPAETLRERDGWEVDMTDVRLGQKVGSGSYGQVFRASWRAAPVAVKLFDKQFADSEELMTAVRREAALMARHRHPHVLLFMGVCTRPPNLAIVTEFCDNGSLHDVLQAKRDDPAALPWMRRLAFAADAARGLNYLHTSRPATIHADLNTSNLLVDRGWRVKVADFGLSRLLQNAPRGVIQGTNVSNKNASHLAPEVLRSEPYGTPSDVFSFGCVLWALATLSVPWERLQAQGNNLAIAHRIAYEQERLQLPTDTTPQLADLGDYNALISSCFQEDPAARPKMEAVLEKLVTLQQRCIRRQKEEDVAAAAAGATPLAPLRSISSWGGARSLSGVASPTASAFKAVSRRASDAAAVLAASAAHWAQPSSSALLIAGLPLLTAVLAWAAARHVYLRALN